MEKEYTSSDFAVMKFKFMGKLASWTMFGFFLYIFSITFGAVPDQNLPSVNTILGFLILEIGIMIGYYFGSSQSTSSRQTQDEKKDPVIEAEKSVARLEEAKLEVKKVIEAATTEPKSDGRPHQETVYPPGRI